MKLNSATNSGNLRQRRSFGDDDTFSTDSDAVSSTLRKFDLFDKVETKVANTNRIKTEFGGISSIITLSLITWLILSHTYYFIFPPIQEHLIVDKMYDKKLEISFDIEFHRIPCNSLGVDVMDVTGEQQLAVKQDITKIRIDYSGKQIANQNINDNNKNDAGHNHLSNDPNDIIASLFGLSNSFQHLRMDDIHKEGCRVYGNLHLEKVNGNFHLALGSAHEIHGKHIHQFVMSDVAKFNCSHTVHKLSFGNNYYNKIDPLNGIQHIIEQEGGGVFTYYIKVIPTEYINYYGSKIFTNQYSFDYKYKHIPPPRPGERPMAALPGVFFVYKMNPYSVQITHTPKDSFIKFIVNLCAIVGGIFAVSGLIDNIAYRAIKAIYGVLGKSDENNFFFGNLRSPMNISSKNSTKI